MKYERKDDVFEGRREGERREEIKELKLTASPGSRTRQFESVKGIIPQQYVGPRNME